MIDPERLIKNFTALGTAFSKASLAKGINPQKMDAELSVLTQAIDNSYQHNPWFIPDFVRFSFDAWAQALTEEKIRHWIGKYPVSETRRKLTARVGIIMAGNIPMVGLHDLLCILASGNHALIKLSKADDQLIPAILDLLFIIDPAIRHQVTITDGPLKEFDAIIATGSNNTSRYFDYYFGRYPNIIRKNRNAVAVISGNESAKEMVKLSHDIFVYFGLGCRNVSKIYLPDSYKAEALFPFFQAYAFIADLHKYRNNYDYQKSILLIDGVPHLDNGFLLVKEDPSLMSSISVLHTEYYSSVDMLNKQLFAINDQIQCIVASVNGIDSPIPFGQSQYPELWDYADNVDSMDFLMNL